MKALVLLLVAGTAEAHHYCEDTTAVLGQPCTAFGESWAASDRPALEIATDLFHETLGDALVAARGTEQMAGANAWGIRERLAWKMFGPAYVGAELSLGATDGGADDGARVSPVIAGAAFGGVRAVIADAFMISGELAGGGRAYRDVRDSLFEARVRLDWWATPHLTVGVTLGTSLVDRDDHTIAFGLGGHLRAFDGGY